MRQVLIYILQVEGETEEWKLSVFLKFHGLWVAGLRSDPSQSSLRNLCLGCFYLFLVYCL